MFLGIIPVAGSSHSSTETARRIDVVSEDGTPVPGAFVGVWRPGTLEIVASGTTAPDGKIMLNLSPEKSYDWTCSSFGFEAKTMQNAVSPPNPIILKKQQRLPWLSINRERRLANEQGETVRLMAHGGMTFDPDADRMVIRRMARVGMNANRLVFRSYNAGSVQNKAYIKGGKPLFRYIDGFGEKGVKLMIEDRVEEAKSYGMYTILDHHDMWIDDKNVMDEYENNKDVYAAWLDLWEYLAKRFKDEPAIAFYEVENEPAPRLSPGFVKRMHDEVIARIRKHDKKHIIAFGHGWGKTEQAMYLKSGVPFDPEKQLIYSLHHYYKGDPAARVAGKIKDAMGISPDAGKLNDGGLYRKVKTASDIAAKYNLPFWFGEFGYLDNYSYDTIQFIQSVYSFADRNSLSTSIWREPDLLGSPGKIQGSREEESGFSVKEECIRHAPRFPPSFFITNRNFGAPIGSRES